MCEWGKEVREERYRGIESRGTIHVLPKPLGKSEVFSGWLHPAFCSVLNIRWQSLHLITSPKLVIWISIDRPWTHLPREHSSTQGRKGSSPSTLCMSFRKPEAQISSSTGKEVTLQIARSPVPVCCFALEAMWQQKDEPPGTDAATLCPLCHPSLFLEADKQQALSKMLVAGSTQGAGGKAPERRMWKQKRGWEEENLQTGEMARQC